MIHSGFRPLFISSALHFALLCAAGGAGLGRARTIEGGTGFQEISFGNGPEKVRFSRPVKSALGAVHSQSKGSSSAPQGGSSGWVNVSYLNEIQRLISVRRQYPRASVQLREEGTVRVAFEIDAQGRVGQVRIESPSSYDRLNEAALSLIQSFSSLPPPPVEISSIPFKLSLPIAYRLN